MVQIWKVPLRSNREDFKDQSKVDGARDFCFARKWVGIGWELETVRDRETIPAQYETRLPRRRSAWVAAARSAHRAIAQRMTCGDFVWCRAAGGIYWLGRVRGRWNYRNSGNFQRFDLFQ